MGSQPLLKGNKDAILFNVYAPLIIGIFAKLVIHFIFRETHFDLLPQHWGLKHKIIAGYHEYMIPILLNYDLYCLKQGSMFRYHLKGEEPTLMPKSGNSSQTTMKLNSFILFEK
jgi:hypothetical protein